MAMIATMCGGGSSRSYVAIIMSIRLIMLTTMAAAAIQRDNWQCDDGSTVKRSTVKRCFQGRVVPFCNSDTIFATATHYSISYLQPLQ
eukprot:scaffold4428_cov57-Cyclotella_meneghiniana.AAC.2